MSERKNFKELLADVEAIVLDVDGVMTDGGIIPVGDDFIRKYNAKDGYAIAYAMRHGLKVCIISGGFGENLRIRLERLGIKHMYLNCMDKIAAIEEFAELEGVHLENTIYMGDDIPDLECMQRVGIPVSPADGCAEVLAAALYISERNGGCGAVRDIIEQVMRAQGTWALNSKGVISDGYKSVASR